MAPAADQKTQQKSDGHPWQPGALSDQILDYAEGDGLGLQLLVCRHNHRARLEGCLGRFW